MKSDEGRWWQTTFDERSKGSGTQVETIMCCVYIIKVGEIQGNWVQ